MNFKTNMLFTERLVFPEGKNKALTFSYDDGVLQDRRLVNIFNQNKLKATFHLNSGLIGNERRLAFDELAQVYRGHEIACHSATHPHLDEMCKAEIIKEIISDRKALESIVGYPVTGMSYPYGSYNPEIIKILRELGVAYSRTTKSAESFNLPDDFLEWHPTCHHKNMLIFAEAFNRAKTPLALFYIWGHSYEFDKQNNWALMENFCKEISNNPDIWYATNIQIYEYISAIRQIEFFVNRKTLNNRSKISIWLNINGLIEVNAGESLCLA